MTYEEILSWILEGDVSIQYRVRRELLGERSEELESLRLRISTEGWGHVILAQQNNNGHWGEGYYQPKWISTHYTLLDLMHLGLPRDTPGPKRAVEATIDAFLADDGELNFADGGTSSDDCVGGMFLGAASYFSAPDTSLDRMADYLLTKRLPDGGWNCRKNRAGAVHSSVHTTISCLEGFAEFRRARPSHKPNEIEAAKREAEEFLLAHHLCWSHRSGEVMDHRMLRLSWPSRWYFDVLRGLEYFADEGRPWDTRLNRGVDVLRGKRRKDGRWPLQAKHPGRTHIEMEKGGGPSRWNTFRALKVLSAYEAFSPPGRPLL